MKQGGKFAVRFRPWKEKPVTVRVFAKSPASAVEKAWEKSGLTTGKGTAQLRKVSTRAQVRAKLKRRGKR